MTTPTTYKSSTPNALRAVIDDLHGRDIRVRIWYGDKQTGDVWQDEHDVTGYIGRSAGTTKIPLIVHNRSCLGGPAILDDCIVRIDRIDTRQTVWQHPAVKMPTYTIELNGPARTPYAVYEVKQATDDEVDLLNIANFTSLGRAQRWIEFMTGKRYSK